MTTPRHGGQLQAIARRFGVDAPRLVDFSASINPDGPPPSVLAALRAALDRPETLALYPDLEELRLKQAIAKYAGLAPSSILAANGFVPLLDAALQALGIRTCAMPVPCFVEYRPALERARVQVLPLPLDDRTGFRYDLDRLLAPNPGAILLANPQNPTGVLLDKSAMTQLIAAAARQGIFILLDEAFIDYLPEHSLTPTVDAHPNLIVFRSVTKCFGMPGLRVAYAAAAPALAHRIESLIPPWSVTTLASIGTVAALQDLAFAATFRDRNQRRREALTTALRQTGLTVYEGAANSILLRLPTTANAIEVWQRLIAEHHLLLRNCENFEGLEGRCLRVAVRNEEENQRLIHALEAIL